MSDHKSLHNVLSLLLRYLKGEKFTMARLVRLTGATDRTIRKYHKSLKEYGFEIEYSHSTSSYSLKEGDESSVHRLIKRLGLYQDTYFGSDSEIPNLRADQPITPGLEDFPDDELKVLYKLYIKVYVTIRSLIIEFCICNNFCLRPYFL